MRPLGGSASQQTKLQTDLSRFNLQALAATKEHFCPKIPAALWGHHMAGQNNISYSQHFMRQQQRVLQIRSKMPQGELCRISCTSLGFFFSFPFSSLADSVNFFHKNYHQPRNNLKIVMIGKKTPYVNV